MTPSKDAETVRSFFRRHSAVPADSRGPQWSEASEAALLDWCAGQCKVWDEQESARPELLPVMKDLRRETWVRFQPHPFPSEERRRLQSAWYAICVRIGFGGDK